MLQVYWNGKRVEDITAFCREQGWKLARVRVIRRRPVRTWKPEAQDLIRRLAQVLVQSKDFDIAEEVLTVVEDWLHQQGYSEETVQEEELGTELVPEPVLRNRIVSGGDWDEYVLLELIEPEGIGV